jgi:hypothetical protein
VHTSVSALYCIVLSASCRYAPFGCLKRFRKCNPSHIGQYFLRLAILAILAILDISSAHHLHHSPHPLLFAITRAPSIFLAVPVRSNPEYANIDGTYGVVERAKSLSGSPLALALSAVLGGHGDGKELDEQMHLALPFWATLFFPSMDRNEGSCFTRSKVLQPAFHRPAAFRLCFFSHTKCLCRVLVYMPLSFFQVYILFLSQDVEYIISFSIKCNRQVVMPSSALPTDSGSRAA